MSVKDDRSWPRSISAGFLAGLAGGELFSVAGLLKTGADLFVTSPSRQDAVFVVIRSVGIYGLIFALAGAGLAVSLRAVGRGRLPVFALVSGAMASLTVLAYVTVWWQVEVLRGLPLASGERWTSALWHAAFAVLMGALVCGSLIWLRRRWDGPTTRFALLTLAVAVVLIVVSDLGLRRGRPVPGQPAQVVVVGLDGLTFRILSPMMRAGELPAFRRLAGEGAWGTQLTYGTASSPLVWTSMATGKKVRDHGIDDFVKTAAGYRAQPMKSSDRKCHALWNIVSLFERRVAVVNWLMTFPPEEVGGYVVSRLDLDEAGGTYPAELHEELEPFQALEEVDRAFAVAHHLLRKEKLDFLAVYSAAADAAEHLHWRPYQPAAFETGLWQVEDVDESAATLIPDTYRQLDAELGRLMDELDEDTLLIVVSDHGQRARPRPRVRIRMNRILEELGHARLKKGDEVDYARSRAYALVVSPSVPELRVNVNIAGRQPRGIVEPADAAALAEQVAAELEALRLDGGPPLFGKAGRRVAKGARGDIRLSPSDGFLSLVADGRELLDTELVLSGQSRPLVDFVHIDTRISGIHDRQGVLFVHGPGVRPGPIGQRAVTTAIQELVWQLTDKVDAVDAVLPVLSGLGLIERATTLDLAPMVLHALGLPVARDMAGRPRAGLFRGLPEVEWIDTYEGVDRPPEAGGEAESDEELLERLRSLGYID